MNNIFSLQRFLMLFKKHTYEKGKEYLLSMAALGIILLVFLTFTAYQNASGLSEDFQRLVFVVTILLTGTVFTSMVFSDLSDKRKATTFLKLPASHFEKYLLNWIFSFLVFQIVFVTIFYLATSIVLSLDLNEFNSNNQIINIFDLKTEVYIVFYIYLFLHSIMLYGAIYFTKKHFIKTVFSLFLIAVSITYINKLLLSLMINAEILSSPPFTDLRFIEDKKRYFIENGESSVFVICLLLIITAGFWVSAFYRLKEKEV